jgi:hypothetical protein
MGATTRALRWAFDLRGREIGPIGTVARLIAAAAALVLPATLDEFSSWDLLVGLAALPVLATAGFAAVRAGYERHVPGGLASPAGTCCGASTWLLAIVLAGVIPLAVLTPVTFTAFWLWMGASLVLSAVRGYGGCEILAFPNILTGRCDQVGCILFTPIDQAETRSRLVRSPASPRRS